VKNKKSLYFLLPLTVFIWGLIVYNIYKNQGNFHEANKKALKSPIKEINDTILDTFSLKNNYKDPFLSQKIINNNSNSVVMKKTIIKDIVNWPEIHYKGSIINRSLNIANVNLVIDNKEYIFKVGESNDGFELIQYKNDSILIKYKNSKKWILKE
jgi:hypothetical protein